MGMANGRCDHSYKSAKKNDLELILEEHLNKNQLTKDAKLAPFYATANPNSPAPEKKPKQRRQTLKPREANDPL